MRTDQASELRRMVERGEGESPTAESRPARVIAVTSGKGGVGKTNLAVNLAARLALMGRRVLLMDADLGLANADVLCGLKAGPNLAHVVAGRCTLEQAIVDAPGGFQLIRGASGLSQMAALSDFERSRLIGMLDRIARDYDLILLDTGAGIGPNVMSFLDAADDIMVVTTPDPTALADAYGVIKVLSRTDNQKQINLLVNMVRDAHEGRAIFDRVDSVCRRFLGITLRNAGFIPNDSKVAWSIRYRKLFVLNDPASPAGQCITRLAHQVDRNATEKRGRGFFSRVASWLAG